MCKFINGLSHPTHKLNLNIFIIGRQKRTTNHEQKPFEFGILIKLKFDFDSIVRVNNQIFEQLWLLRIDIVCAFNYCGIFEYVGFL